jgi:alkaline phosphatase D
MRMSRSRRHHALLAGALLFSGPAAASPDPAGLLRPYYAQIRQENALPQAEANPALPASHLITRLAFGSCNHQERSQAYWQKIMSLDPQLFLMIGDNVYGDPGWHGDAALGSLRASYQLQASHPEFRAFRRKVPMMTVWDDHDFGFNDGSGSFVFREWAEEIYENFWNASPEVRSRPGVYESAIHGPEGRRVQVIMLDTRFFRTPIALMPLSDAPTPLGRHLADDSLSARMLGEEQWRWLSQELARPADLRLIVSSIQVLTDAHRNEGWFMMPRERERLYSALSKRAGGGLLLLSGDRHRGAIYSARPGALGKEVWEFTSSSLNLPFRPGDRTADEPDPLRRTVLTGDENFGLIDIDWQRQAMVLTLMGKDGQTVAQQNVGWDKR